MQKSHQHPGSRVRKCSQRLSSLPKIITFVFKYDETRVTSSEYNSTYRPIFVSDFWINTTHKQEVNYTKLRMRMRNETKNSSVNKLHKPHVMNR